jgi:hypothetical protein
VWQNGKTLATAIVRVVLAKACIEKMFCHSPLIFGKVAKHWSYLRLSRLSRRYGFLAMEHGCLGRIQKEEQEKTGE